jgi:ABC-type polysaccharide/polyol phosphate export permease
MTETASQPLPAALGLNRWIRQIHRWLSIAFTLVVLAIFLMLGIGKEPASWVYFLPLFPLFLLMATGLWLFALPYVARWRGRG